MTLRVKRVRRKRDGEERDFQLLQEKRWWGWKTIDFEEIPPPVVICSACFGDTGGWISKFTALGEFDRTGRFI